MRVSVLWVYVYVRSVHSCCPVYVCRHGVSSMCSICFTSTADTFFSFLFFSYCTLSSLYLGVWKSKAQWHHRAVGVIFIPVQLVMVHKFHGAPNRTEGISWICSTVEGGREREGEREGETSWQNFTGATKAFRMDWNACKLCLLQKISFNAQTSQDEPLLCMLAVLICRAI